MKDSFHNNIVQPKLLLGIFLSLINSYLLVLIHSPLIFSYSYTLILFFLLQFIVGGKESLVGNFIILQIYIILAVLLYFLQLVFIPDWNGFSGMYGGVGTDDSRFYAAVTDNYDSIPLLARSYVNMDHSFVVFLKFLYPFPINHPLTIILPNLLGIAFIPFFTAELSKKVFPEKKGSCLITILVLFCPVILSNGLILMRDGWTAFLSIAGLYYLQNEKKKAFLLILIILTIIRPASGLLLAVIPLFYFRKIFFSGSLSRGFFQLGFVTLGILLILFVSYQFLSDYLLEKGISGFARQEFVESFIKTEDSDSTIYKIYSLPFYLRIPLGFLFFLFLPFLRFEFYTEGILNVRNIMFKTLMPFLSVFYFRYFLRGVIFTFRSGYKPVKRLFYLYVFLILIISQISIQPRHKTAFMPLFYILVVYGYYNRDRFSSITGNVFIFIFVLVQLYFLF